MWATLQRIICSYRCIYSVCKKTSTDGTVSQVRHDLPVLIQDISTPLYSTGFYSYDDVTMTIFRPNANNVVIFSTRHPSVATGARRHSACIGVGVTSI